jgi:hypothetical protein
MRRPRQPWSGYALQLLAAGALALSWLRLYQGLVRLPSSDDPTVDLEAGGGFTATLLVYLPGLLVTAALVAVLLVALVPRPFAALALLTAAAAVILFSAWILVQDALLQHYLTDYLPGLATCTWQALVLAVLSAGLAWASRVVTLRPRLPSAPSRPSGPDASASASGVPTDRSRAT